MGAILLILSTNRNDRSTQGDEIMRKILFRGKNINDGKWVYGAALQLDETHVTIYGVDQPDFPGVIRRFEVIPDTVGQYTGLDDRNGNRIFEGDIVKHYNRIGNPEVYDLGHVYFYDKHCMWKRTDSDKSFNATGRKQDDPRLSSIAKYEVIGNIHDNPELMEVKE